MTDKLSPAGSAVYNSDSLTVGDGTWDSTTNTFLLPNLQGLPFATMQYNGMGNRFSTMPQYQNLVKAHGILAAIAFLLLVPLSVVYLKFYRGSARWAMKVHIWCQILVVLITTALFILGFMAVGPERSLTNPHHGIGVAIYVLILTQFFHGWFAYAREKRKPLRYAPLKAVLHRWIGGATALLGIVQVPLGLTLYGSPVWLFVLYSLLMTAWLFLYFVLSYQDERDRGKEFGSDYSFTEATGSAVGRRNKGHFSTIVKTAAAGAGAAYLFNRFRKRDDHGTEHSGSYMNDEKYSAYDESRVTERHEGGGLGKKLLGLGALGGIGLGLGRMFRRRERDVGNDTASYTASSRSTEDHYALDSSPNARRPLNGGPPPSAGGGPPLGGVAPAMAAGALGAAAVPHAPAPAHRRQDSYTSYSSDDDYSSASPSHQRRNHGIRDTIATVGALGLAKKLFSGRKARKEQRRIDELRQQDVEDERINRTSSQRNKFTGDGYPSARRHAAGTATGTSVTSTNLTPLPGGGAVAATASGPLGPAPNAGSMPYIPPAGTYPYQPGPAYPQNMTVDGQPLPFAAPPPKDPVPPPHASGAQLAAGAAGAAAGLAAGDALRNRDTSRDSRRHSRRTDSTDATAPVSVKLNMHNDGRHVTLRRLTEEEAAADRERREVDRRQRRRRQQRVASASSMSGVDEAEGGDRWRRAEAAQRQAEAQIESERQRLQASQAQLNASQLNVPPPPPIPSSDLHTAGSVTSPGSATEASTSYEINRQRRRAERQANARARRMEYD